MNVQPKVNFLVCISHVSQCRAMEAIETLILMRSHDLEFPWLSSLYQLNGSLNLQVRSVWCMQSMRRPHRYWFINPYMYQMFSLNAWFVVTFGSADLMIQTIIDIMTMDFPDQGKPIRWVISTTMSFFSVTLKPTSCFEWVMAANFIFTVPLVHLQFVSLYPFTFECSIFIMFIHFSDSFFFNLISGFDTWITSEIPKLMDLFADYSFKSSRISLFCHLFLSLWTLVFIMRIYCYSFAIIAKV